MLCCVVSHVTMYEWYQLTSCLMKLARMRTRFTFFSSILHYSLFIMFVYFPVTFHAPVLLICFFKYAKDGNDYQWICKWVSNVNGLRLVVRSYNLLLVCS